MLAGIYLFMAVTTLASLIVLAISIYQVKKNKNKRDKKTNVKA